MRHRIIWCDNRWCFEALRLTNEGGNTGIRTEELEESELEYLKDKWGRFISFRRKATWGNRTRATSMMTVLRVPRKQPTG